LDYHRWVNDGQSVYASGTGRDSIPRIFQSTDYGDSWSVLRTLPFSAKYTVASFVVRGDSILLQMSSVDDNPLLFSIDLGRSWINSNMQAKYASVAFGNSIFAVLFKGTAKNFLFSSDFFSGWQQRSTYEFSPLGASMQSVYVSNDRLFVSYQVGPFYYIKYRTIEDSVWKISEGLDSLRLSTPSCQDNNTLFTTSFDPRYNSIGLGNSKLFYSRDNGSNWEQLGDSVTYSTDVFIGSEYIYLTSLYELWRMPKSVLPPLKAPEQNRTSSLLINCFPNPATTVTRVSYSLPQHRNIVIQAFDVMGRHVANIESQTQDAGPYETVWDTRTLPPGSYIIRINAGSESASTIVEIVR